MVLLKKGRGALCIVRVLIFQDLAFTTSSDYLIQKNRYPTSFARSILYVNQQDVGIYQWRLDIDLETDERIVPSWHV